MRLTLQEIASAVHDGALPSLAPLEHTVVTGISTDTRALEPGDLFVALSGPNFDGHEYVAQAFDQGAVGAVVEQSQIEHLPKNRGVLITVPDTRIALGQIARDWRRRFSVPVIGVTGSVGKTTTKEMIALALSPLGKILKTADNENNEIGVPKLLLRLTEEHKAVVVEMGMRGAGQIAQLAAIAEPTVGVITRIAENHIELLGSIEAIAQAKGELIEALPKDGIAILNADDPFMPALAQRAKCRTETYGFLPSATLTVRACEKKDIGYFAQVAYHGDGEILQIPSPALHDVGNALASTLVALELGVPLHELSTRLTHFDNAGMRMEVLTTPKGATILSDCYNASPTSMKSALETIAAYPAVGKKVAFLGDMRELGDFAPDMHRSVSRHAGKLGIEVVYAVGSMASEHFDNASQRFADSAEAAEWAKRHIDLSTGDVALVKGSRALAMEKIVEALIRSQ